MSPEETLAELLAGNRRYRERSFLNYSDLSALRERFAEGQVPFAAILGCADSRVPPELIFDQSLGRLFVVRVVGNVAVPGSIGSLEYSVAHLQVPLVFVLGHERCGAAAAAVKGGELDGTLGFLIEQITPVVEKVRREAGDLIENVVVANVAQTVDRLKNTDPILSSAVHAGRLVVAGGRYDLDTGAVTVI